MDRVTKSFVEDFKISHGFDSIDDECLLFEHFSNYTIVEPKTECRFDIEGINIGKNKTIGLDGFALLLNKQFINTKEELVDYLKQYKKSSAEVIFIQTKTSTKFEVKDLSAFGLAVNDFIAEKQKLKWSNSALENIELFNELIKKISDLKEKPVCSLYYVTLGKNENDQNILATTDAIKNSINKQNVFSEISIELIGASDIQSKYKRIGQAVEKSFDFSKRLTLPVIKDVKEAYIGVVDASTIINLMTNDDGSLLSNVFYDNVRDYQGDNDVNNEISGTIRSNKKDAFSILNNGITIVAENLTASRDTFTILNYQIINGCQTSHVLFENKTGIDKSVKVPIKLIVTENETLMSQVIRSTNRQTEVKEQDLLAFTTFQKELEDYYGTFKGDERLYYERRSKQYNDKPVEKKRIIDKTTQIKAVTSLFYDKPDMATRYFGALFSAFGKKLFKDNHEKFPYYVASYAIFKIDGLFRANKIDKRYKKIKYHLLNMLRHEVDGIKCPPFESKKSSEYCNKLMDALKNETELLQLINNAINKIGSLKKYDPDDKEISKSKDFVKKYLQLYK